MPASSVSSSGLALHARRGVPHRLLVDRGVLGACSSSTEQLGRHHHDGCGHDGDAASTRLELGRLGSSELSQFQALPRRCRPGSTPPSRRSTRRTTRAAASQTITIEQKPPKSVFSTASGSVINDGTHTYFCSASGGQPALRVGVDGRHQPLGVHRGPLRPDDAPERVPAAEAAAAAPQRGLQRRLLDSTYAGLHAKCVSYTSTATQTVKYCVTNSGILAYAQSAGGTFELTGFSSSPAGQRLHPARGRHGRDDPATCRSPALPEPIGRPRARDRAGSTGAGRATEPEQVRQALEVLGAGAEQRGAGLGPLHVEVHVVLPRVADAAQALDALRW